MENKLTNLFNKELILRILSLIIFIPIMIFPIVLSNYLIVLVYLVFNSIIICEINTMKPYIKKNYIFNFYIIIVTYVFFIFIIFVITGYFATRLILETIFTIWLFDTFSYLGGRIIGGKKLMPNISSGKTISGLLVGIILTIIVSLAYQILNDALSIYTTILVVLIIMFSFLGDLSASLLKRYASIKDAGTILPGHGGLFDRFDSFIGVFFILGLAKALT